MKNVLLVCSLRRDQRTVSSLAAWSLVVACATAGLPASAAAETFAVLSYNVRGIPPPAIEDRSAEMEQIAPLLEDFHTEGDEYEGIDSVVGLQELFFDEYYKVLVDPETVSYPFITEKDEGGPAMIGDGLNLLSDFKFDDFKRVQWDECFGTMGAAGSDCDTNKGYSYARVQLADEVFVDVYTLHADAGQDEGSREARRGNIKQLIDGIADLSQDGTAVIVLGDTNSLYTRFGDDNLQDLLDEAKLTDVWVELRRGGTVPGAGSEIEDDCKTTPSTGDCELVDKVLYRDSDDVDLTPLSYEALKDLFSDELGEDLSDHYPVAVTFDFAVEVTTTTTTTTTTSTTSTTTTTTTTLPNRPCGDPVALVAGFSSVGTGEGRAVVAGDALFVLKAAVGSLECALCTCDVNDSGSLSATDALLVLKKAVGQEVLLGCPPCVS